MLKFFLVDIKNITTDVSRSNFKESELENVAELIIECGGIVKPLILKATDVEHYKVIDGHFEYYAAATAREKNPRQAEMVNAFVISSKNEQLVAKQIDSINNRFFTGRRDTVTPDVNNLESRLSSIENRIERQINQLREEQFQARQQIDEKIKNIENQIPQRMDPLNLLNTLNKEELAIQLQRSRISKAESIAKAIVDVRQKQPGKKFENYRDIVKLVKGLSERTLLVMIDDWSRG